MSKTVVNAWPTGSGGMGFDLGWTNELVLIPPSTSAVTCLPTLVKDVLRMHVKRVFGFLWVRNG